MQHSERKKWYSYFDNVQAVLFMVALSGYDQNLDENNSTVSVIIDLQSPGAACYRNRLTLDFSKPQMISVRRFSCQKGLRNMASQDLDKI